MPATKLYPDKPCEADCGKSVQHPRKFCSLDCQAEARRKYQTAEWLRTGQAVLGSHPNPYVRIYLRGEQKDSCAICGSPSSWMGKPLVFTLDHIDGDSTNNIRTNLRLVCPNCDSQLDTYKAKNKGKGRYYRRERYANGQSY